MSADYIVGEIRDGRLPARQRLYESGRKRYRIDPIDFADYITKYWPRKDRRATPTPLAARLYLTS